MNGEKRRRHGRSIRRRLLVPICLLLTVQVAVLIGGVYFSGLLERMDENAYAVLDQRVQSRAGYLEDDMVRRWSNLSLTQEVLGELYEGLVQDGSVTPGELASDPAQYNAFLEQAAPELVSLMRTNSVTGAFVVLNTQTFPQELSESLQLPGLYLRDRDPSAHTSAGNGDLLLERAPLELVRGLGIAMDSNWKPMFVLEGDTARADACLIRPYNAAVEDPSLGWENAGYWAAPHTLSGDNIRLISYSVPLIAPDGTVYGVLGVDILEDYLLRLLPYDELSEDHGSAYIWACAARRPEASVRPQVVSGPVYLAASGFSTVYLEKESAGLYTLERGGGEEMYVCSAVLNLYNTNTPLQTTSGFCWGRCRAARCSHSSTIRC
ncbi:MAG: PDC sensor domain-containing protein [Ruthenibacterium lactatiformans]